MNPAVKYQDDFNEIVDLVWDIYRCPLYLQDSPRRVKGKSHLFHLGTELQRMKRTYFSTFLLDKQDITQQLTYLWLKYTKMFMEKSKRKTSLRDYLLQSTIMSVPIWYRQEVVGMSHDNAPSLYELMEQETDPDILSLNLAFVAQGTNIYPLSILSPFERYLIFLKFKMEKPIVDIAYIVQKDRKIVGRQLVYLINKLRSLANATKKSE